MARTLGWGSKGREFESRRSDHEVERSSLHGHVVIFDLLHDINDSLLRVKNSELILNPFLCPSVARRAKKDRD